MQATSPEGRVDWKTLRAQVDLAAVATNLLGLGRKEGNRLKWHCPFHAERTPSFAIKPGEEWYRCFGCQARGDAANLLAHCQGLSFSEAVRWLADFAGVGASMSTTRGSIPVVRKGGSETAHPTTPQKTAKRSGGGRSGLPEAEALALVELAAKALWESEGAETLAALKARGLRDETIRAAGLGWTTRAAGAPWQPPGLVIPWCEGGRLSMVQIRPPDLWREGFPQARRPPKYIEAARDRPGLYIAAPLRPGLPAIACEGVLDTLVVAQAAGEWAGVATAGSASVKPTPALVASLIIAPRWLIALDADRAGDEAAAAWTALAPGRCSRVRPEGVKDWGDFGRADPVALRCLFARLAGGPALDENNSDGSLPLAGGEAGLARAG